MAKFRFYKDEKITIWERTAFIIEAETKEKARELAKTAINQDVEEVGNFDYCEVLHDTREYNTLHPNELEATIEILDNEFDTIADNRIKEE